MKTFAFAILCLLVTIFHSAALDATKGFETASVNIGYLRQQDFGQRVVVADLAAYIKRLQAVCSAFFADTATAEDLDIVVAVRPGNHTHVWFVSSRTPAANEKRHQLRTELEAIEAPKVTGGPIAFCINGRLAGGSARGDKPAGPPPMPKEWRDALSKQKEPLPFDSLLPLVWPGPAKNQFIGHWRYADDTNTSEYTFREDGTFTSELARNGKVLWESAGKWSLAGDTLNYELTKSSVERIPVGTTDRDNLVEVTDEYYIIEANDGTKRKYSRIP